MRISVAGVEVLVWVLIYGGLLTFALGLALRNSDALLGHGISIAGLVLAAVGAGLIWVRVRMVAKAAAAASPAVSKSSTDSPESPP